MAAAWLPVDYCSDCDEIAQVRDILQLLSDYQWIYDVKVTQLFKERTWEKLPDDWSQFMCTLSMEELSALPDCEQEGRPPCVATPTATGSCPKSLVEFISRCGRCSLDRGVDDVVAANALPLRRDIARGMNPKKEHEVSRMAGYVVELCKELQCTGVVDAGAGLGYLGQCLSVQCGLDVYGIECVEERAETATDRMKKIAQRRKKVELAGNECVRGDLPSDQSEFSAKTVVIDKSVNLLPICLEEKPHHAVKLREPPNRLLADDQSGTEVKETNLFSPNTVTQFKSVGCHGDSDALCVGCHGDSDTFGGSFSVIPLTIDDSEDSLKQFVKLLEEVSSRGNDRICLIGLHCCGDLTPTILKWFSQNLTPPCLNALVVLGCCYHKMADSHEVSEGCSGSQFQNFPLSPAVKQCLKEVQRGNPYFSLNTLAMRLAAQETKARWVGQSAEDHTRHMKYVSYRAIMEVSMERVNISVPMKVKRRAVKERTLSSFLSYVEDVLFGYSEAGVGEDDLRAIKEASLDTYQELAQQIPFVEVFTALQVCLQGPLESLLLLDRLLYLKTSPLTTAHLTPLFSDAISPRNMALVGVKRST